MTEQCYGVAGLLAQTSQAKTKMRVGRIPNKQYQGMISRLLINATLTHR